MLASNRELARKLEELEQRIAGHDEDIKALVIAIRNLMSPQAKTPKQIGFKTDKEPSPSSRDRASVAENSGVRLLEAAFKSTAWSLFSCHPAIPPRTP